ncbi:MAG: hypothetical protein KKA60_04285 [Proteobacteria bacterium]|nr:hypothetical protein [Pseudomonadota bacterium]
MAWDFGAATYFYDPIGYGTLSLGEQARRVAPLLELLVEYDEARVQLQTRGGKLKDLEHLDGLLKREIRIQTSYGVKTVNLTDQRELVSALSWVDRNLHLQVRRLAGSGFPAYCLCRLHMDGFSEYGVVAAEWYMSPGDPGYPDSDPRFLRLLHGMHEVAFVRMSKYRSGARESLAAKGRPCGDADVDRFLYLVARHVCQSAWSVEQNFGVEIGRHLSMPRFVEAIELAYLCLAGDHHLCALRGVATNPCLQEFFHVAYPQAAIGRLIRCLPSLPGDRISEFPKQARNLYLALAREFSDFLGCRIQWGFAREESPLWKVLYANYSRLSAMRALLLTDPSVQEAAASLDRAAEELVSGMLDALVDRPTPSIRGMEPVAESRIVIGD